MKKFLLLGLAALLCWSCSTGSSDYPDGIVKGPGSETTNGIVALVDGVPAAYAGVALRKVDFTVSEDVPENAMVQPNSYAGANGSFEVDVKPGERVRLTVVHSGFAYSRELTGEEISKLHTLNLQPTASVGGTIDVPEGCDYVWVGVVGMDVFVRSDSLGNFIVPQVPSSDSLQVYFVRGDKHEEIDRVPVKFAPYEVGTLDLRTDDPKGVAKFVATIDGKPASYAMAALRDVDYRVEEIEESNASIASGEYSDKNGAFKFTLPDSGTFRFTVVQSGYAFSKVMSVEEIAELDIVELTGVSNLQSKVTLRTNAEYLWVGVYGLDVLVKTNEVGAYVLPNVPAGDTLSIYFLTADSNELYTEWNTLVESSSTQFLNPVKVLQDFENNGEGWYLNTDSLKKGTELKPAKNVKDGIEYDSTRKSNVFHGKYKLANDDYAWALVGTSFEHYMKFSEIDSVVFYAKGSGNIRLSLENYVDPTMNLKAATEWIPLSSKWKRISVNPAELCVGAATTETCFTSWSGVKNGVKQFHIFVQDGSEFYIDDVTLYGALF